MLQGYAANKVTRVTCKGLQFWKWKKSVPWNWHFGLKDEGHVQKYNNPVPQSHLFFFFFLKSMEVAPDPMRDLGTTSIDVSPLPPAAPSWWGSSDPGTDGVPMAPAMKYWTLRKS